MKFTDYLESLFYDYADEDMPQFDDMRKRDQRELTAKYIEENEDLIHDILAEAHQTSIAGYFADIARSADPVTIGGVDLYGFANDLKAAIDNSITLRDLIDAEICRLYPKWYEEYLTEGAEAAYDQARMH